MPEMSAENANQTQLKPIIWYTSWYFSRGGGGKKIYPPLPRESLFTPLLTNEIEYGREAP